MIQNKVDVLTLTHQGRFEIAPSPDVGERCHPMASQQRPAQLRTVVEAGRVLSRISIWGVGGGASLHPSFFCESKKPLR